MMDPDTRHRLKTPLFYRRSLVEDDAERRYRLNALLALQDPPPPLTDRLLWGVVVVATGVLVVVALLNVDLRSLLGLLP